MNIHLDWVYFNKPTNWVYFNEEFEQLDFSNFDPRTAYEIYV